MGQFAIPTPTDQRRFLLRLYFGNDEDCLLSCVRRAYLDFCRTLRGFGHLNKADAKALQSRGATIVRTFLASLPERVRSGVGQAEFDKEHRSICDVLCAGFKKGGFPKFRIGQAQKWLNMAIKYIFVFGEDLLPGFARLYPLAHMPIDNVMLDRLRPLGAPRLSASWSRLNDYAEYLAFQNWVRSTFKPSVPLAVEFHIWQDLIGPNCSEEVSAPMSVGRK